MLQRIPVGRRFSDTLYIAPGVSSGGQVGEANPSMSGGSGLENQYIVDGVNITNAGYGALGSYSIVFGSLGNGVPFDFIKETQVKTGGYEAEFGQSTGGVVNVVTKSGTNTLRGSVFGYFRPESPRELVRPGHDGERHGQPDRHARERRGRRGGRRRSLPNHVFFFGAIDPQWQRTTYIAPEGFPLRSLGNVNQDRRIIAYAAKGTWQVDVRPSRRRVVLRRSGRATTDRSATRRCCARTRPASASWTSTAATTRRVRYEGAINANLAARGVVRAREEQHRRNSRRSTSRRSSTTP